MFTNAPPNATTFNTYKYCPLKQILHIEPLSENDSLQCQKVLIILQIDIKMKPYSVESNGNIISFT